MTANSTREASARLQKPPNLAASKAADEPAPPVQGRRSRRRRPKNHGVTRVEIAPSYRLAGTVVDGIAKRCAPAADDLRLSRQAVARRHPTRTRQETSRWMSTPTPAKPKKESEGRKGQLSRLGQGSSRAGITRWRICCRTHGVKASRRCPVERDTGGSGTKKENLDDGYQQYLTDSIEPTRTTERSQQSPNGEEVRTRPYRRIHACQRLGLRQATKDTDFLDG